MKALPCAPVAVAILGLAGGPAGAWVQIPVDTGGDVGSYTSLLVVNGRPAIAYHDATNNDLIFVRSANGTGSSWQAPVNVSSTGEVGRWPSLQSVGGNPAISFYDLSGGAVVFVRALDVDGASWGSKTVVATVSGILSASYTSLAMVAGNPAVVYDSGPDLMYVRALDSLGASWGTAVKVDRTGDRGSYGSLAVVNGNPAVAYAASAVGCLVYTRATDATGSAWGNTLRLHCSSGTNLGQYTSLRVVNGAPAITYHDPQSGALNFARAGDPSGNSWVSFVRIDGSSTDVVGTHSSMAILFGRPAVSYYGSTAQDLRYSLADDPDGTAWGAPENVDGAGELALYSQLQEVNGIPGVSYYDSNDEDLKYAFRCPLTIVPATLPDPLLWTPYSQAVSASGGVGPYTYTATGVLPPGLTLSSSGILSGTPSSLGSFSFTLVATDANGCADSQGYSVNVLCGAACLPITIQPATFPPALVGGSFSQTLTASGGAGPYEFSSPVATLPPGLSLSLSGVLSGVSSAAGTFTFTVTATDVCGCTGDRTYTVQSSCPAVDIVPVNLPNAKVAVPYGQALVASGATAPYLYTISLGSLPQGLTLSGSGVISGTPLSDGTSSFEVTAAGAFGCTGSRSYQLMVDPQPMNYVVGQGLGQPNLNRVRVFDETGGPTLVDFLAYGAGQWGTNVSSGGVSGGVRWELLTGPGPGQIYGPQVRGFDRAGTPLGRLNYFAYGTLKFGVNVGRTDLDGDTFAELLSGAGPGAVFGPHVRGWNFDGGTLAALMRVSFFAYGTLKFGANVADGDVDADGYGEILTGPGPGAVFASTVRAFNVDGGTASSISRLNFTPFAWRFGVNVSGGDVDLDGFDELVASPGPDANAFANFRGFDSDGGPVAALVGYDVTPYPSLYGGRVGTGELDGDGVSDLVTGQGPDPSAAPSVAAFRYQAQALTALGGTPFTPFPDFYGVTVSAGRLGY